MEDRPSLARQEKIGQPVLLVGSGYGVSGQAGGSGDQRQTSPSNAKGDERTKASDTSQKGKDNAEDKGGGRKRGRKRGRSYSFRDAIREVERRDNSFGRSAKELGIEWLDGRCEENKVTKAHYMVGRTHVDGGTVFMCVYCGKVKWLPNSFGRAQVLGQYIERYGKTVGYQKILDRHPAAKRLLSKIQDIYYLRKSISADQFPIALAAVMLDREYPYDAEITEEEVL